MIENKKTLINNQEGFIVLEAILSGLILIAIVSTFLSETMLLSQQKNIEDRTTAQYLAQEYLNILEYNQSAKQQIFIPEQIIYNDKVFTINIYEAQSENKSGNFGVEVVWQCNGKENYEYQERRFSFK